MLKKISRVGLGKEIEFQIQGLRGDSEEVTKAPACLQEECSRQRTWLCKGPGAAPGQHVGGTARRPLGLEQSPKVVRREGGDG